MTETTRTQRKVMAFPNSGFEDGNAAWMIATGRGDCRIIDVDFPDSRRALQIKATADTKGARVDGPMVPCDDGVVGQGDDVDDGGPDGIVPSEGQGNA